MARTAMPDDSEETHEELATTLAALANATRLAILKAVVVPRPLHLIRVRTLSERGVEGPRLASRQAVKEHLDRLVQHGIVHTREGGQEGVEYVVNHRRLFQISEEVRDLASVRMSADVVEEPTIPAAQPGGARPEPGPRLLLVKGLREGRTFELGHVAPGEPLVLGRRDRSEVPLSYDPYVSSRHALLARQGEGFTLEVAPEATNPAYVNLVALQPGEPRPLRHGDVIHLGRSVLVFWER